MIKNFIVTWIKYLLYFILVFVIPNSSTFATCDWQDVNALIDTYSQIEPENDHKVKKTQEIFERVRAVTNTDTLANLVVINSENKPWAVALPKNHVVLSRGAIDVIIQHAPEAEIDARLAFVLGHELAHLAHDDFLQLNVRTTCFTPNNFSKEPSEEEVKELAADQKGFIYAAMAGYDVGVLLKSTPEKPNFLVHWIQHIGPSDESQSKMEERTVRLNQHLQEIHRKIPYFEFGVRLAHLDDQCGDAVYFLEEFKKFLWSREVLNNLGVCYLQRARQSMEDEHAQFYWMPTVLDTETQWSGVSRHAEVELSNQFLRNISLTRRMKDFLERAQSELEQAVKADKNYVPAWINLAVVDLYLGKPFDARSRLEEARKLAPNNLEVQGLIAIAVYEGSENDLDLWPQAVKRLEELVSQPGVPLSVIFNLARLSEIRLRNHEAFSSWKRLASKINDLPPKIRQIICKKPNLSQACSRTVENELVISPPWQWPISFEQEISLREQPAIMKVLKSWGEAIPIDFHTKQSKTRIQGNIYQSLDRHIEILELNNYVVMQVLKGDHLATIKDLPKYCGQPIRKSTIAQGKLWSCNTWTALELNGQIREVWGVGNYFER